MSELVSTRLQLFHGSPRDSINAPEQYSNTMVLLSLVCLEEVRQRVKEMVICGSIYIPEYY